MRTHSIDIAPFTGPDPLPADLPTYRPVGSLALPNGNTPRAPR